MTHKNRPYTAPEAELLVIRFEENFTVSGGEPGAPGAPGGDFIFGGGVDDNIFDLPDIL